MGIFSDDRANELRNLFFDSSQEILQALIEEALLLEKSPRDAEIVRNLRRSVHTLKGDSAACGYKELSELAHAVEDVLTAEIAARDGEALAQLVLVSADSFDNLLSAYRNDLQPPSTKPVFALIEALLNPHSENAFAPQFNWSEYEQLTIAKNAVRGQRVYNIALAIDPACPMRAAAVQLVRNVLQEVGTILVMRPDDSATEISDVIEVALASHHELDWVERKSKIPTVVSKVYAVPVQSEPKNASSPQSATAEPVTEQREAGTQKAPESAEATLWASSQREKDKARAAQAVRQAIERPKAREERVPAATENVIRVEAERVDVVLDLVGELIIAKSMMQELLAEMNRSYGNTPLRTRTADILTFQSQILNKLQRAVMKIRMVPVEQMFRRLPRVVRDTAKQTGREVNIVIEGENTDLDKSILDALAEPMMHLLRNAVDHGIEPPLERAAAGKSPEGTIRLNAYHQGNQVILEISDDGSGINLPKVVEKAISRGILTAEQAARLSDNDALDLIFHAGLSTASEVTEISGRGIGMDVVKAVMDRLKGSISVRSIIGEGTTFRLKVPLTLAIIKALLFRVSEKLYAVPLGNVLNILRAKESEIHFIDGQEVLQIHEEIVPLIRLSQMHPGGERRAKLFVIVVSLGDRKVGFVVDRLIGEQELVIKALDETMVSTSLISGASILGDGRVVLILSISDVVEKFGRGYNRSSIETEELGVRS
ncbi:MAG TPA: chemotaxis protein CheA [Candidatus Saccharimonadales bacterium]|nr:chemotaxis protein CheA [Candidatus Saccharimonadales bacterium]